MADGKKSKIGYVIAGVLIAITATLGTIGFINYTKRKKLEAEEKQANYLENIIKTLKEQGISFGEDDSVIMKALAKLSNIDLNNIVNMLKKGKLEANDKAEIFALILKVLSPVNKTTSGGFQADGLVKTISFKNKKGVVKAKDNSGMANLYKIVGNEIKLQVRKLQDGNSITVEGVKVHGGILLFRPFLDVWVKAEDVVLD